MKRYLSLVSMVTFLLCTSFVYAGEPTSKTVENRLYRVVWVIDGDTIRLDNRQHVRLIGIDAPENRDDAKLQKDLKRRHTTKAEELEMGKQSARFLRDLISGRKVKLKFDKEKYDQYHRVLAYVYLTDGTFINSKMIKEGYAYYYDDRRGVDTKYLKLFKDLYKEAKDHHRGLWKNGGKNEKHLKFFSPN